MRVTGIDEKHGVFWEDIRPTQADKPTIVFVHGAFMDAATWDQVAKRIHGHCPYIVAANPLLGIEADTAALVALLRTISGEIILVGHSYGGALITNAAGLVDEVKALVYVSAIAPDEGESFEDLAGRFPGGGLGDNLASLVLGRGRSSCCFVPINSSVSWRTICLRMTPSCLPRASVRPIRRCSLHARGSPRGGRCRAGSSMGTATVACRWNSTPTWHNAPAPWRLWSSRARPTVCRSAIPTRSLG